MTYPNLPDNFRTGTHGDAWWMHAAGGAVTVVQASGSNLLLVIQQRLNGLTPGLSPGSAGLPGVAPSGTPSFDQGTRNALAALCAPGREFAGLASWLIPELQRSGPVGNGEGGTGTITPTLLKFLIWFAYYWRPGNQSVVPLNAIQLPNDGDILAPLPDVLLPYDFTPPDYSSPTQLPGPQPQGQQPAQGSVGGWVWIAAGAFALWWMTQRDRSRLPSFGRGGFGR